MMSEDLPILDELERRLIAGCYDSVEQTRNRSPRTNVSIVDSAAGHPLRGRWRMTPRRGAAVLVAALVAACGATLAINRSAQRPIAQQVSPQQLATAGPRQVFRIDAQAPFVWRQPGVLLNTVRQIATITVPGLGRLQYWIADSTHHWLCTAMRLPDGSWIGTANRYHIGGSVPGCLPPPPTCTGCPDLHGFDLLEADILPIGRDGTWRLFYGAIPTAGHPTAIRELTTGLTAPVLAGRYVALLLPAHASQHGTGPHRFWSIPTGPSNLATVTSSGTALARWPDARSN
jgi:hypothetical protein